MDVILRKAEVSPKKAPERLIRKYRGDEFYYGTVAVRWPWGVVNGEDFRFFAVRLATLASRYSNTLEMGLFANRTFARFDPDIEGDKGREIHLSALQGPDWEGTFAVARSMTLDINMPGVWATVTCATRHTIELYAQDSDKGRGFINCLYGHMLFVPHSAPNFKFTAHLGVEHHM